MNQKTDAEAPETKGGVTYWLESGCPVCGYVHNEDEPVPLVRFGCCGSYVCRCAEDKP